MERDLRWESELRGVGLLLIIQACLAFVMTLLLAAAGVVAYLQFRPDIERALGSDLPPWAPALLGGALVIGSLVSAGLQYVVGRGLQELRGWARLTVGVFSAILGGLGALTLLLSPGNVLSAGLLIALAWVMLSGRAVRVTDPTYRALMTRDPDLRRPVSICLIVGLVHLGLQLLALVVVAIVVLVLVLA